MLRTVIVALLVLLCAAQPGRAATVTRVYLPLMLAPAHVSLLDNVNSYRTSNGKPPLADNARLDTAAQIHADDMLAHNFFGHKGSDGSQPWDRVTRTGYTWSGVAENLAWNATSCADATGQWANSDGHKKNMLGDYRDAGTGTALGYCVLVLANPM